MKRRFLLVGLLAIVVSAHANLVIHISQGIDKPYPIAVLNFAKQPLRTAQLPEGFIQVVKDDLTQSGRFGIEKAKSLPVTSSKINQFPWSKWGRSNNKAQYVLLGQVTPTGTHMNKVSFQLLSVYGKRSLLARKYQNIPTKSLRVLAHQISNQVFQAITGIRGQFNSRLAYVVVNRNVRPNKYRLIIADADGFNPQTLLTQYGTPIASPTWSPSGKGLAYVSYVNNRMAIYEITLATGKRHLVANFPGLNSAPAFSPDGKSMAMALSLGNYAQTNLYLMNLKTKHLRKLTRLGTNTSPNFSPDGKNIVFTSNRGGRPQVYQINVKSKAVKRLSYSGAQNFSPKFTPNGSHIVMMHQDSLGGPIQIALLNPDSGYTRVLTNGNLDKSPSVSPNGTMVVYANYDKPNGILEETSITGRIRLQLPATTGSAQSPAWSPFII